MRGTHRWLARVCAAAAVAMCLASLVLLPLGFAAAQVPVNLLGAAAVWWLLPLVSMLLLLGVHRRFRRARPATADWSAGALALLDLSVVAVYGSLLVYACWHFVAPPSHTLLLAGYLAYGSGLSLGLLAGWHKWCAGS